jgi:hypothetical protein
LSVPPATPPGPKKRERLRAVWDGAKEFIVGLWRHLKPAVQELIVHFVITILTILSLEGVEKALEILGLDQRTIYHEVTFAEWMFYLDLAAVTGINIVGVLRALIVVFKGSEHG